MSGSILSYKNLNDSQEKILTKKVDMEWGDGIPLQNMSTRKYPFDPKRVRLQPTHQGRRRSHVEAMAEPQPGPSSQVAWNIPLEQDREPGTSAAISPASVDKNDNNNNSEINGNANRAERGIDKCSSYYLFYTTLIQSCLKMSICILAMSLDVGVRLEEPDCNEEPCLTPDYPSRGVHFLVAIALFALSTINFCVGLCIFTQSRFPTHQMLKGPMNVFAIVLVIEIFILVLSNQVILVNQEIWLFVLVILTTELIAIFMVFLYPHSYYHAVDNPALNATEDTTMVTGTGTRIDVP